MKKTITCALLAFMVINSFAQDAPKKRKGLFDVINGGLDKVNYGLKKGLGYSIVPGSWKKHGGGCYERFGNFNDLQVNSPFNEEYAVYLQNGVDYNIELTSINQKNFGITLIDKYGRNIQSQFSRGNGEIDFIFQVPNSGEYKLIVFTARYVNDALNDTGGDYELSINTKQISYKKKDYFELMGNNFGEYGGGGTGNGINALGGTADTKIFSPRNKIYKVNLQEGSFFHAILEAYKVESIISIVDPYGNLVGYGDNEALCEVKKSGEFKIFVSTVQSNTKGNFDIQFSGTFIAPPQEIQSNKLVETLSIKNGIVKEYTFQVNENTVFDMMVDSYNKACYIKLYDSQNQEINSVPNAWEQTAVIIQNKQTIKAKVECSATMNRSFTVGFWGSFQQNVLNSTTNFSSQQATQIKPEVKTDNIDEPKANTPNVETSNIDNKHPWLGEWEGEMSGAINSLSLFSITAFNGNKFSGSYEMSGARRPTRGTIDGDKIQLQLEDVLIINGTLSGGIIKGSGKLNKPDDIKLLLKKKSNGGSGKNEKISQVSSNYKLLLEEGGKKFGEKSYNEALLKFEQALSMMNQKDTLAAYYAMVAAITANNNVKANTYFETYLNAGGKDIGNINYYIEFCKQNGEIDKALSALKKGLLVNTNDSWLLSSLVNTLVANNRLEEAISFINKRILSNPNNVIDYIMLSYLFGQKGDKVEWLRNYEKAISIDPNQYDLLYSLAVFYYEEAVNQMSAGATGTSQRRNFEKAASYFERSYKIRTYECELVKNLNQTYKQLGSSQRVECYGSPPDLTKKEQSVSNVVPQSSVKTFEYRGVIADKKTKIVPNNAIVFFEDLATGETLGQTDVDRLTGEFVLNLPYGKRYGISAKGDGFISASTNIDLTKTNTPPQVTTNELNITTVEAGNAINLNNIFFETGKAALLPESFLELNRIAEFLKENASVATEIAGHTDNVGTDAANQILSQDRANAVRYYLQSRGIQASRLIGKGYGKNKPIALNTTETGRQQNRRVEFVILRK